MAPLSLKIVQGGGAITRTVLFDTSMRVSEALEIVKEKVHVDNPGKDYGLFLTSAEDELSGVWLEGHRSLDYYMLRDGDSLQYLCRTRNLRVRMLDGSEKTMQIDESKCVGDLMKEICDRIGITNHDEYGLCFEDEDAAQDEKPAAGTLTLRKRQQTREKDAKLEQLSKKLKTDDNVEWLVQQKTLREMGVDPKKTLLLKRRLFYSDRNVDSRDPVQLNLLYVQTRDAILDGRQVLTEEKAVEFAGIQCQVQYGDFQEDKHKPGFIENLKEFLPEQYASSWGIERKVLKEHSKHHGLSPLEAKHLYTRNARELPTYGVTFFLVKEQQKGKKKLVPRLLGINAESILRLDEVTKEILQVWMLTQVKTFRAGKETFTLDFGDYSDKEYTVKTNEAHRIRDILQGYIDIIHRSLAAPFNVIPDEGQAICEDNVQSSRGHIIQNIVPMKVVEQTFVGPSKLVPYVQGSAASEGTQITTVKQMTVTNIGAVQRQGVASNAGVLRNNSLEYLKKLNRLNTNSVETVAFLTDPNYKQADKIKKVNGLVTIIEEDMNCIVEGVHKSVENDNEEVRKKLLSELDELCANFNLLISTAKQNNFGTPESLDTAQEAAEMIVSHCTQMYCSLDPGIKRRSRILKHSHKSFIADEKTEATLRRASFQLAASRACRAVDDAKEELADRNQFWDSVPEGYEVKNLEEEARKKIANMSAAVALLMSAQADPNNLDYSAAINSMITIDELLPELVQDTKALGSVKSEKFRQSVVGRLTALCDVARKICALTGVEDKEQMQEFAYQYAKAADKLVFTFGLATVPERENEILDMARDVGDKTSLLLMKTHELTNLVGDPRAGELDAASQRCADDSRILLACAQLTASSIDEPHCQSAMTAAAETLASSIQHLSATWKPLVEEPGRRMFEQGLATNTTELMRALERLKEAYANLAGCNVSKDNDESDRKQKERLKFIATINSALDDITGAEKELVKDAPTNVAHCDLKELQNLLGQRLSALNAAVASLIRAASGSDCEDYNTAEEAVSVIAEMIPQLVRDAKVLGVSHTDEKAARALLKDIQGLCAAAKDLCADSDKILPQDANESASKFARHSSKLCYMFMPRKDNSTENMIIELSKATCERASELLTHVNQLAEEVGADDGQELDQRGAKLVDVVQALLTSAQITAPSFEDARCQSAMLAAADEVSSSSKTLATTWIPLVRGTDQQVARRNLETGHSNLETAIDNLRTACKSFDEGRENVSPTTTSNEIERERLKFVTTLAAANNKITDAGKNLKEPIKDKIQEEEANLLEKRLAQRLAQLNAAVASVVRASAGEMDYSATERAFNTISELLPIVIEDIKSLSTSRDIATQHAMLHNLYELFDTTQDICCQIQRGDTQGINDSALKFAESSGKLTYVLNNPHRVNENPIVDLSKDACEKASLLLTSVQQLAEEAGGEEGQRLDEAGCKVVNAAGSLLVTTQILGPTVKDTCCMSALMSSIDDVCATVEDLDSVWKPMKNNPIYDKTLTEIERERNDLESALKHLRGTCERIDDNNQVATHRDMKLRRIRSVSRERGRSDSREVDAFSKIDELSRAIYGIAMEMTSDGKTMVDCMEGDIAERVEDCAETLLDATQDLHSSIANLKQYPGDPRRNYSVLAAIEAVNAASMDLVAACSKVQDEEQEEITEKLLLKKSQLDDALRAIRVLFKDFLIGQQGTQLDSDEKTKQWLSFNKIISDAACDLEKASVEFSKPVSDSANITNLLDLQRRTARKLAELNAAVASLMRAVSDLSEPDYATATEATKCITQAMPNVIRDIKLLSTTQDEATRKNTMEQLKSLYDALQSIFGLLDSRKAKDATDAISKYVGASRKLMFEFSPTTNLSKGQQIEDLAAAVSVNSSQLLRDVYSAAQSEPGQDWRWLEKAGDGIVNASQNLLTTAKMIALTPDEEQCKSSMQSAIDEFFSSCNDLYTGCNSLITPGHAQCINLNVRQRELDAATIALKEACEVERALHEPEKAVKGRTLADIQRLKEKLSTSINSAKESIIETEEQIRKIDEDERSNIPTSEAVQVASEQLERKLVLANVAASHLVCCNDPEEMDYKLAFTSVDNLSELIPTIVQDLKVLNNSHNVMGGPVAEDALSLCEATKKLCTTIGDNRENLNEAVVDFANSSARLLYDAGSTADPEQERQVISRVKAIGDCASRLVAIGAAAARDADDAHAQALCDAGGSCARAASKLLYITKLVAPFIQHPESESIFLSAAEQLSSEMEQYESAWQPLSSHPKHTNSVYNLKNGCKDLKKLLAELKDDIKNAKLVIKRQKDTLLVEDSPLRQLTSEILNNYKTFVESPELPMEERRTYAQIADKLSAGLKELDVAGAHCRNSPQDLSKLRGLEYATQELQHQVLKSRPRLGVEQSNVVDLMDYVKDVVSSIEDVSESAENFVGQNDDKHLQDIKEQCCRLSELAVQLQQPKSRDDEALTEDLRRVDDFAQSCKNIVPHLHNSARNLPIAQSRRLVENKLQTLNECINLLRFAAQSALATAEGAALDECLHDLIEVENKVESMLTPVEGMNRPLYETDNSAAAALYCVAACPHSAAASLTPALATYLTDMRMRTDLNNPEEKHRLEEHLNKLIYLLKALMITTSRRVMTWQQPNDAEVLSITDQIIQELEEYKCSGKYYHKGKPQIIENVDVRRLLLQPSHVHMAGDKRELTTKYHQAASKLNSTLGTLVSSAEHPQALSRSLHATADAAVQLSTLARALGDDQNRVQTHRIEESAKDMCFATFNVLKVGEQVSWEPDSIHSRRKLLDAIRALNISINRLTRAVDPNCGDKELIHNLKLQQGLIQTALPSCALGYPECVEAVQNQSDIIYKLKNDDEVSHEDCYSTLHYVATSVSNASEYAAQCAYLISISEKYKDAARNGVLDVVRIQGIAATMQDTSVKISCSGNNDQIRDLQSVLNDQSQQLQEVISESKGKFIESADEKETLNAAAEVNTAVEEFNKNLNDLNKVSERQVGSSIMKILDHMASLQAVTNKPTLVPKAGSNSVDISAVSNEVVRCSRELLNKMLTLVNEASSKLGTRPWSKFEGSSAVIRAFDELVESIKDGGRRTGLLQTAQAEEEEPDLHKKSNVETQVALAMKWLQKPSSSEEMKSSGLQGVNKLVEIAKESVQDLNEADREEMQQLIEEVQKLTKECSVKYKINNKDRSGLLLERLQELQKMLERVVVTRVVEDFLEDATPFVDLELLVDVEKDEKKRKYILEQKIAELLAQIGRVTRTAQLAADTASPRVGSELAQCRQQVELLAPSLVKATQERINSPQHQPLIDKYNELVAQYAESMSKVRILCDRSVDPVDFVQAASETMQRLREESSAQNDPLKAARTSNLITRLGMRAVEAGMSSTGARNDPELKRALSGAQRRLESAVPAPGSRASRASKQPDWRDVVAEILRTTGEVESALSGENIFQRQLDPNQPIYAAALDLHATVREWSARDNEIVAVAKRMAVLMARLSDYMNHDKKREVIATSKAIVKASSEVAALARKLALECTDVRIRTNLLQVCDRIPTISGQLKMLTTVKGSSLGHQGNQEDVEAMNMLVGNAQNLMQSIQEVVNAAAGASVKIMSQRGRRMRWVRKNYNY